MARLEIDHLNVSYGAARVVNDLSLTVEDGECIALLGPSGCGKTTTLRAIAGFVTPTSGRIRVGSRDMVGCAPHLRNVGLVFQDYALFSHMSVADNVAYGLKRRRVPAADIARRVDDALKMVRLHSFAERYPNALSGGQRQRVALARALVIEPDILLLDEPLGALDRKLRDQMQDELKTLQAKLGLTCIIVTHDQEEALSLASRVALMLDGDIAEIGTPLQLYANPRSLRTMDFLGASVLLDATVEHANGASRYRLKDGVYLDGPATRLADGTNVKLGVRPELISLGPGGDASQNVVRGVVRQVVFKGPFADVYLDAPAGELRAQVDTTASQGASVQPGQTLGASIRPESILVFPPER